MDQQTAAPEVADAGVTEGVSEPSSTQEESPSSESTEGQQGTSDIAAQDSHQKKSENRFQKLANENKKYRSEIQKFQSEKQLYQDAIALDNYLKANPEKAKEVFELLSRRNAPQETKEVTDPYSEFDPLVAEKFRKLDKFEQWVAQQEEDRKQSYAQSVQQNRAHLERRFEDVLKEKGIISQDGTYNEKAVKAIAKATLGELMELTDDPYRPTEVQLNQALNEVLDGMSYFEKRAVQKTIKQPGVPPSGSKSGMPTQVKKKETSAERIARMTAEL